MTKAILLFILLNFNFDGGKETVKIEKTTETNQIHKRINKFPADYKYSGWRGGIGVAFGQPVLTIPDITELGLDIIWGSEDPKRAAMLDIAVFDYWNSVVEISLKDPNGRYDFSQMEDKDKAAILAFDKFCELQYDEKGLSKYADVKYKPDGAYGDVYGEMDLSSINPLAKAVVSNRVESLMKSGKKHGGIAMDNAGKLPKPFLEYLQKNLHQNGFGIFTNGGSDELYKYIDLFAIEGFHFSQQTMNNMQEKGFKGILGEFSTRQLSSGEMEQYLKAKHFNGIVFFGYTDGRDRAAGTHYSFFASRPDIYNHQRWILRKILPLSKAMFGAGAQKEAFARSLSKKRTEKINRSENGPNIHIDATGRVVEPNVAVTNKEDIFDGTLSLDGSIKRYGDDINKGIYLYINTDETDIIECNADDLGLNKSNFIVYDEFSEKKLKYKRNKDKVTFKKLSGPSLIQLGKKEAIIENILSRITEIFESQMLQRQMDDELGLGYTQKTISLPPNSNKIDFDKPLKPWEPFCKGYVIDLKTKKTGRGSLRADGSKYSLYNNLWDYHNRQGATQFVTLNQSKPVPLTLTAFSKSIGIQKSELKSITDINRRNHFGERLGYYYAMHLYLDYQDGSWPEVHTYAFSPGTHDWEKGEITVIPKKAVKTAMVLVELLQPEGTAWFDDFSLIERANPQKNLLVSADFDDSDILLENAKSLEYNKKITLLMSDVDAVKSNATVKNLKKLENEILALKNWLSEQGVAGILGRETRDIEDAVHKINICKRLLTK